MSKKKFSKSFIGKKQLLRLSPNNSGIMENLDKRQRKKSIFNKRQNSEKFNGRIPINNRGKGNYSNNSSLINKYNSIDGANHKQK